MTKIHWFLQFLKHLYLEHPCFLCVNSVKMECGYLCVQGVNDQRHADKELRGELGQILSEAADAGVDLLHAAGVDEVAAGALIDVPGREQAEGALPR